MSGIKRELSILAQNRNSLELNSATENKSFTVLVLNSNRDMANEIASQLASKVDECNIIYAPTLETAKILLKKRTVDLIVSSPMLPDGHITRLQPMLESLPHPPNIVIFADKEKRGLELFESPSYQFISVRQVTSTDQLKPLQEVSQEIRDSLNNPLQEIVALVFVAHTTRCSETTNRALDAIEQAAQKMAGIVWGLEDKIYRNMLSHSLRYCNQRK
jgi:anion-transporting  ArsA/GET3 family ATPase